MYRDQHIFVLELNSVHQNNVGTTVRKPNACIAKNTRQRLIQVWQASDQKKEEVET
jgi:hypothetical protein